MAKKHLPSSDPRKTRVVQAMKEKFSARKITLVIDNGDGSFTANALRRHPTDSRCFVSIGDVTITAAEAGIKEVPNETAKGNQGAT